MQLHRERSCVSPRSLLECAPTIDSGGEQVFHTRVISAGSRAGIRTREDHTHATFIANAIRRADRETSGESARNARVKKSKERISVGRMARARAHARRIKSRGNDRTLRPKELFVTRGARG